MDLGEKKIIMTIPPPHHHKTPLLHCQAHNHWIVVYLFFIHIPVILQIFYFCNVTNLTYIIIVNDVLMWRIYLLVFCVVQLSYSYFCVFLVQRVLVHYIQGTLCILFRFWIYLFRNVILNLIWHPSSRF